MEEKNCAACRVNDDLEMLYKREIELHNKTQIELHNALQQLEEMTAQNAYLQGQVDAFRLTLPNKVSTQ